MNIAELILKQTNEKDSEGNPQDLKSFLDKQRKKVEQEQIKEKEDKRKTVFNSARKAYIDRQKEKGFIAITVFLEKKHIDKINANVNGSEWTRSDEVNKILEEYYNGL